MLIVCDAYNILKQRYAVTHISSFQRGQFIDRIERYADQKTHSVLMVFDGTEPFDLDYEPHSRVELKFAGPHESADAFIVRFAHEHKGLEMVVVTDDRQIARQVKLAGVHVIAVSEFLKALEKSFVKKSAKEDAPGLNIRKIVHDSDFESSDSLDILMRYAAQLPGDIKDEDNEEAVRKPVRKQLRKQEKKRFEKIKKL